MMSPHVAYYDDFFEGGDKYIFGKGSQSSLSLITCFTR